MARTSIVLVQKVKKKWISVLATNNYEMEILIDEVTKNWKAGDVYEIESIPISNGFRAGRAFKKESSLEEEEFERIVTWIMNRDTIYVTGFQKLKKIVPKLDPSYEERYFDLLQEQLLSGFLKKNQNEMQLIEPRIAYLRQLTIRWFGEFEKASVAHHRFLDVMIQVLRCQFAHLKQANAWHTLDFSVIPHVHMIKKDIEMYELTQKLPTELTELLEVMCYQFDARFQWVTLPAHGKQIGLFGQSFDQFHDLGVEKFQDLWYVPKTNLDALIQRLGVTDAFFHEERKALIKKKISAVYPGLCKFYENISDLF